MAGAGAAGHTLSTSTLSALAHADLLFRTFREAASRARFGHTTVDYTSLLATGLHCSSSCSGPPVRGLPGGRAPDEGEEAAARWA